MIKHEMPRGYTLTTSSKGLPIIRLPMKGLDSVTVLALTNTGSRYEKPSQEGIAHFFEHMVFKGTERYPDAQALATAVDSIGANFNAFTSKEYTGYYVKSSATNLRLSLDVVSDMLLAPKLRQEDIDRERGVIIEELNMYVDSPARHISNLFDQMFFRNSGLSHDIIGSKETINSLMADDFKSFLQQWYGFGNMVLVLAGDDKVVSSDETTQMIEEMFGKKTAERAVGKVKLSNYLSQNPVSSEKLHVEYRETQQAHFMMGWPALKRQDKRRFALSLLSVIMGGNMSSRLFCEVREKRGLCYYVHSGIDQFHDSGVIAQSAGVDPKRIDEAIKVSLNEFYSMTGGSKPITDEELNRSKEYLIGKMILGFEDSESVAQYYGIKQLLFGEIETPSDIMVKLRAVTKEEVIQVAQELIKKDELRFGIIGPSKDAGRFEGLV